MKKDKAYSEWNSLPISNKQTLNEYKAFNIAATRLISPTSINHLVFTSIIKMANGDENLKHKILLMLKNDLIHAHINEDGSINVGNVIYNSDGQTATQKK